MGVLNPAYATIQPQILSQDPLPSLGTLFALLQNEEGRGDVMVDSIPSMINQNQSAFLTTNSVGRGDGGRGRGHRGGARGGGGRTLGGAPDVDRDKLQCTHCGRTRHTRDTWAWATSKHQHDIHN